MEHGCRLHLSWFLSRQLKAKRLVDTFFVTKSTISWEEQKKQRQAVVTGGGRGGQHRLSKDIPAFFTDFIFTE